MALRWVPASSRRIMSRKRWQDFAENESAKCRDNPASVIPSAARNPSENLKSAKNAATDNTPSRRLLGFGPVRETRLAPLQRFAVTAPIFVSFALKRRNAFRSPLFVQS